MELPINFNINLSQVVSFTRPSLWCHVLLIPQGDKCINDQISVQKVSIEVKSVMALYQKKRYEKYY